MAIRMTVTNLKGWETVAGSEITYEPLISCFGCALYWVTEQNLMSGTTKRYLQIKRIPGR